MQRNPRYRDLMAEVHRFLADALARAVQAGVRRTQVIVDPGLGFGKTREHNLEILRRLAELRSLGTAVMCGPSRKRFIGETLDLGVTERLEGTAAACVIAVRAGANIVRVHDVRPVVRAVRMADAVGGVG
jgi:dihydropteroate synthase